MKADSNGDKRQGDDTECKHIESQNWASISIHRAKQAMLIMLTADNKVAYAYCLSSIK
jgi:hypothetical protein